MARGLVCRLVDWLRWPQWPTNNHNTFLLFSCINFESSSSYFDALAELHIEHLRHQRNDAVESVTDCWRKYVTRQLFRRLARDHRLTASTLNRDFGPFKLWCDDLRPSNVLLNADLQIVGVIDWYGSPMRSTDMTILTI